MSEHRNNIQVAIDALYSQRRRKSPGDESETLTRRNDAIFGNHVWQTFAQYFPLGLEKTVCVEKNHSYGVICRQRHPEKPNDVVGVSAG